MMITINRKFSKLARLIIVFNLILTLLLFCLHVYSIYRIRQTSIVIHQVIEEQEISREKAIEFLKERGVDLFLGDEFFAFFGFLMSITAWIFTYLFAKNYNYMFGMAAALFCLLATFLGGLLLFYLILSNRAEADVIDAAPLREKNDWENWIHKRSKMFK